MSTPVITAICKNLKKQSQRDKNLPDSRYDYNEQKNREKKGLQMMWDDTKGNTVLNPGGIFGFVHNGEKVEIHIVTKVCNPSERLKTWSRNVGHNDRNVLMLTPKIMEIDWNIWSNDLKITPKMERGTRAVRSKEKILVNYVKQQFNYDFDKETGEIFVL